MRALFLSLVIVFVFASYACATPTLVIEPDSKVCWENPTTTVFGALLTDLAGTWVYYAATSKGQTNANRIWNPLPATCIDLSSIPGLTKESIFLRATAASDNGNESDWSNEYIIDWGNAGEIPSKHKSMEIRK